MSRSRAKWTIEQEELLKKFYPIRTANEMKKILPTYSITQMNNKAKKMGIKKMKEVAYRSRLENSLIERQDLWTDEEKKIVIEMYPRKGVSGVKELLPHRSEHSIKRITDRLGITRIQSQPVWELVALESGDTTFSVTAKFKRR